VQQNISVDKPIARENLQNQIQNNEHQAYEWQQARIFAQKFA
jgi:hypothetical protein